MMKQSALQSSRLLLVYNADGGIVSMVKDGLHKLISPSTYPCSLCAITYGAVSMRTDWDRFLKSLPLDIVFHHKDDFAQAYPGHGVALPAILIASGEGSPRVLVSATDLDAISDTNALMDLVEERLVTEQLRQPGLKIVA